MPLHMTRMTPDDDELHRRAMDKVLSEIEGAMDDEDAKRQGRMLKETDSGDSEEPTDPENIDLEEDDGTAKAGGHPGQPNPEDVVTGDSEPQRMDDPEALRAKDEEDDRQGEVARDPARRMGTDDFRPQKRRRRR